MSSVDRAAESVEAPATLTERASRGPLEAGAPRLAGFGAVAAVAEFPLNVAITQAIRDGELGPVLAPLPTAVSVLGVTVTFAGLLEVDELSVELHDTPADSIVVHFSFTST